MKPKRVSPDRLGVLLGMTTVILVAAYLLFIRPALRTAGSWISQVGIVTPCTNNRVSFSFTMPEGRYGSLILAFPTGWTDVNSSRPFELENAISGHIAVSDGKAKVEPIEFDYHNVKLDSVPGETGRHWPYCLRIFPESSDTSGETLKSGKDYRIDVSFTKAPPTEASLAVFWYRRPGEVNTNLNVRFWK